MRTSTTTAQTETAATTSSPVDQASSPSQHGRELQADEREQRRVEDEDEDRPEREALQARLRIRQLGGVPAEVDACRDRGQDRRDAGRLGREIGEIAGQQRDGDLAGRVGHTLADLPHHVPHREPDRDARDRVQDQPPAGLPEREGPGRHRDDGDAVEHERGRVVDEALALDDRDDAPRRAQPPGDRGGGNRVGRRDDGPQHERRRPRQVDRRSGRPPPRPPSSPRRARAPAGRSAASSPAGRGAR